VTQLGIKSILAKDGLDALNILREMASKGSIYDQLIMVISDIEMPEMDGYTFTAEVRHDADLKDLYILLHTSLSGVFNKAMVAKVGANNFIPKFDPDELASAVQSQLRDSDIIVQMDADFSHDPAVLTEMARRIESYDVVLGSRYTKGGSVDERWPFWRKGLSVFGNFYARSILNFPLRDVTTGYRMWRREYYIVCHWNTFARMAMSYWWRWFTWRFILNIVLVKSPFILQIDVGEIQRCLSKYRLKQFLLSGKCAGSIEIFAVPG